MDGKKILNQQFIYINSLRKIKKKFPIFISILLIKRGNFTDNIFYYVLCIIFRAIHLISFCGNYFSLINDTSNEQFLNFNQYIKIFSCFHLINKNKIPFQKYILIIIIIIILLIFRIIINSIIFSKNECFNIYLLNKYKIMADHIIFLFFPFIIEYLSLIYYIFFFPNKFLIQTNNKLIMILFLIINAILIIEYNIENYINMICINRTYKITFFDAYLNLKNKNFKNKTISYKCSNIIIYIFIFLQNFPLFVNIENYLIHEKSFKAIVSVILLMCILLYFFIYLKEFNYSNFINSLINSILSFCLYTIIFEIIMNLAKYKIIKRKNEIIYFLAVISLSYITNIVLIKIKNLFFISKILEILFQENNNKNKQYLINSFYYLHQIMLSIKEQNNNKSSYIIIKALKNHFYNCLKIDCKCKLFKECEFNNETQIQNYIPKIIIILNYLIELVFLNYNIYQDYELLILL